MQPWRDITLL